MRVKWEVADGYAGKSRPHYVDVPDDELEECETEQEREKLIDEYVQEEFDSKIFPTSDNAFAHLWMRN